MGGSLRLTVAFCIALLVPELLAQGVDVSAKIVIHSDKRNISTAHKNNPSPANVVVWLSALQADDSKPLAASHGPYRLLQKDKQFHPHLLVVPTGTSVEFPNTDPFFHNVFSLFNGKRFDLGLYESGTSRSVRFDREGVSYIFCNIHPEMGAVVLALSTPYYAVSDADGVVLIHGVPPGSYHLNVWSETATWLQARETPHNIQIGSGSTTFRLGEIAMQPTSSPLGNHKNKFGEDYQPEPHQPY